LVSEKVAKKETKALFKQLSKKLLGEKTCRVVDQPNPPSPRKATAPNQVGPTKDYLERSENASSTKQAKSCKKPDSIITKRKVPNIDPNPIQAKKWDKREKGIETSRTTLEEMDPQKGRGKGETSAP
jgi:hypothetical protein